LLDFSRERERERTDSFLYRTEQFRLFQVASFLTDDGKSAHLPNLNLNSLRELQLLMLKMDAVNLADLYVFLKTCQCPNLERLFVQVNTLSALLNFFAS
jgi:hypothetical protein